MKILTTVTETVAQINEWKKLGLTIGFVPTMGYLHEGHASLMRQAVEKCDKIVVSIFVNPTQFAVGEDLESYPRDLKADSALCEKEKVDLIFAPTASEMYPKGFATMVNISRLSDELCGRSRPDHFAGVCLVVTKLFAIITPDFAYFGEKDAQQLAIIKQMTQDLNFPVTIVPCPIVREADGLAKSSRNAYLSEKERESALILKKSLDLCLKSLMEGEKSVEKLESLILEKIATESLAMVDYVQIVDKDSLQKVEMVEGSVLVALAVKIGKTRLIDNFFFEKEGR